MIDQQKIIGLLQAKALECLNPEDEKLLHDFIDGGHVFPWDELGAFQSIASFLPMSLPLEIPNPSLKDKVALRLIKLTEEMRAQKSLEEQPQANSDDEPSLSEPSEIIEAEFEQKKVEEFQDFTEPVSESKIELLDSQVTNSEIPDITEETNFNMEVEEATFNLDDVVLPDYESIEVSHPEFDQINQSSLENIVNTPLEEPEIESPPIESFELVEKTVIEPLPTESIETLEESVNESLILETSEQPEEPLLKLNTEDTVEHKEHIQEKTPEVLPTPDTPDQNEKTLDLTKRSIADKMFKAIEQDFDSLKYHYEESERKLNRGLLISYIVIAVLFALLIFSFFKFSVDLKELEKEIKSLKNNPASSLIDIKNISSTNYFFC